jgi:hypothetical protein
MIHICNEHTYIYNYISQETPLFRRASWLLLNPHKNISVNQAFIGLCQSAYSTIWLVKNGYIETLKKPHPRPRTNTPNGGEGEDGGELKG